MYTAEPLLRGHPDERPPDNANLNINALIPTPEERPSLLKGHFSSAKGVASQEGFHCKHHWENCMPSQASDRSQSLNLYHDMIHCHRKAKNKQDYFNIDSINY